MQSMAKRIQVEWDSMQFTIIFKDLQSATWRRRSRKWANRSKDILADFLPLRSPTERDAEDDGAPEMVIATGELPTGSLVRYSNGTEMQELLFEILGHTIEGTMRVEL